MGAFYLQKIIVKNILLGLLLILSRLPGNKEIVLIVILLFLEFCVHFGNLLGNIPVFKMAIRIIIISHGYKLLDRSKVTKEILVIIILLPSLKCLNHSFDILQRVLAFPAVELAGPVGPFNQVVSFALYCLFLHYFLDLVKNNIVL